MVWTINNSKSDEASKVRWDLIPYCSGRMLDVGCGAYKVFPHCIGIDNGSVWGKATADIQIKDASKLDIFASQSIDCLFSSHLLEHIVDYKAALREWWRVLKQGGFMCLYLPHKLFYPNVGEYGSNPDHKHDFMPEDIVNAMKEIGSWDLVEEQDRNENDEYSFFLVFKKQK